jgi:hypothetical protein
MIDVLFWDTPKCRVVNLQTWKCGFRSANQGTYGLSITKNHPNQRLLLGINWEMQQPLGNSSKFGYVTNNPNRVETDKKVREIV